MPKLALPAECEHTQHQIRFVGSQAQKHCTSCQRFLGFLGRHDSQQRRAETLAKVNELWNAHPSSYDREFLMRVVYSDGAMTARQEARLNGLWARKIVQAELNAGIKPAHTPGMRG